MNHQNKNQNTRTDVYSMSAHMPLLAWTSVKSHSCWLGLVWFVIACLFLLLALLLYSCIELIRSKSSMTTTAANPLKHPIRRNSSPEFCRIDTSDTLWCSFTSVVTITIRDCRCRCYHCRRFQLQHIYLSNYIRATYNSNAWLTHNVYTHSVS